MPKKRTTKPKAVKARSSKDMNEKLLENFIQLQKVNTDLAEKFDHLTKEISQLLSLFELAAKSFSKHPNFEPTKKDSEFLDKIDKLLEQNKTIAKGLTLMEENVRQKMYSPVRSNAGQEYPGAQVVSSGSKRPLPRF